MLGTSGFVLRPNAIGTCAKCLLRPERRGPARCFLAVLRPVRKTARLCAIVPVPRQARGTIGRPP